MKTIKKHMKDLKQVQWNYYEDNELKIPFSSDDTDAHELFIQKYFNKAEKEKVLSGLNLEPGRDTHTTSIFFLGILLYHKTKIGDDFWAETNKSKFRAFPFIWFLTSLFHDYAFNKEEDKELLSKITDFESLIKEFGITNNLLEKDMPSGSEIIIENIKNYFEYRRSEGEIDHGIRRSEGKIDHGIVGGMVLYDELVKNRLIKEMDEDKSKLYFGEDIEELYIQAASAIAMHNIWILKEKDAYSDEEKEWATLIKDYKQISIKDFPLLYLLGIVDTIDPIKAYKEYDPNYVLDNLSIEFSDNKIIIKNEKSSALDFSLITDTAKGFKGWLNVDVCSGEQKLELTLH